jgi:hypothetical protein
MPERTSPDDISYVKAALQWQYNLIGLAGAVGFAAISGSELPLILGAGMELIYLSVVPQMARFQRLVRSWKYADEKREIDARLRVMFQQIPPEMRVRYGRVDTICKDIRANYARLSSTSQIFVQEMQDRLDGLLQGYLRLLHASQSHYDYLRTTDPERIKREVAELKRTLTAEPVKVQEINRGRIEILGKRVEKFCKIKENSEVIHAQCAAIEDVLQLIRDQSVSLRDPQQVSDQLEGLVRDVEQTEMTVKEMEGILDLATPDASTTFDPLSTPQSGAAPSANRVRH